MRKSQRWQASTDDECAAKFDQVRSACPTVQYAILLDANADEAGREWWTSYHQVVEKASPEFTRPKTRSDDPCLVYFTSDTVGYPKMVLHTHARSLAICRWREGWSCSDPLLLNTVYLLILVSSVFKISDPLQSEELRSV